MQCGMRTCQYRAGYSLIVLFVSVSCFVPSTQLVLSIFGHLSGHRSLSEQYRQQGAGVRKPVQSLTRHVIIVVSPHECGDADAEKCSEPDAQQEDYEVVNHGLPSSDSHLSY